MGSPFLLATGLSIDSSPFFFTSIPTGVNHDEWPAEAASDGRSRKPFCYRMCHSLKDRSTLSFPPVSTHAWFLPTGPRFDMLVSQVLPNQLEIGRVVRHERCP